MNTEPDAGGHFGVYGGRYVPEVLMSPLEELEIAYREAQRDPAFQVELTELLRTYAGRPTPLYFARRFSETLGGARLYFKREDLLHTGAHKINNALGQALLARRIDRKSTRLNSSHLVISYAVFCLKKKKETISTIQPA